MLITGIMHTCTCANNYWKWVNSKCLRVVMLLYPSAYILESSTKKNIINVNIYDVERRNVYCKLFPLNLPKLTTNEILQQLILQGFADFFQRSFVPNHFIMLHKIFFHQIKKQKEMTLYLPGPNLSGSFVCCNFMHSFAIS